MHILPLQNMFKTGIRTMTLRNMLVGNKSTMLKSNPSKIATLPMLEELTI